LRKARDGDVFVLLDPGVVGLLLRVLPADAVTFHELDIHAQHCALVDLVSTKAAEIHGGSWQHFWNTPSRSGTGRAGRLRGELATTGDFYGDRQWRSTGIYIECIAPYRVDNQLVMPLPAPPGTSRRLVFFRAAHRRRTPRAAARTAPPGRRGPRQCLDRLPARAVTRHRAQTPGERVRPVRGLQPDRSRRQSLPGRRVALA
jgi:hypothetical protein